MNRFFSLLILFLILIGYNTCFANEKLNYDFSNTNYIPIRMNILNSISSRDEIYEGQEIKLKIRNDIFCHGYLIAKKGTIASARIETIVTRGMNGFPAEIFLGNFKIEGINESQLMGEYVKTGRNYALLVYPIKWALTPIPFVGSLTNLIMGGEAYIDADDIITIKYYPHWN